MKPELPPKHVSGNSLFLTKAWWKCEGDEAKSLSSQDWLAKTMASQESS